MGCCLRCESGDHASCHYGCQCPGRLSCCEHSMSDHIGSGAGPCTVSGCGCWGSLLKEEKEAGKC
jgi:hypothetical protein